MQTLHFGFNIVPTSLISDLGTIFNKNYSIDGLQTDPGENLQIYKPHTVQLN